MAILTLIVCLLLISSAFSDAISPNTWIIPSFLGIGFGILLIVSWCWAIVLLLTRRWYCLIAMAVAMLIVCVPAWRLCPLHLGSGNSAVTQTVNGREIDVIERVKVLSYNTCLMGQARMSDLRQPVPVVELVRESGADIVCLQEYTFATGGGHTADRIRRELKDKYPYYDYTPYFYSGVCGLALYSRYPIRKGERIDKDSRAYSPATYYQLEIGGQRVGLVNMHMQSNNFAKEDRILYKEMVGHFRADSLRRVRSGLMHSLAVAWRLRATEAEKIRDYLVQNHPQDMPLMICGDMNDTPVSYCSRTMRSVGLDDTWSELGFGPGITYHEYRFWFRIDHIFHSEGLRPLQMDVLKNIEYSDHYPIEATFQLLPR